MHKGFGRAPPDAVPGWRYDSPIGKRVTSRLEGLRVLTRAHRQEAISRAYLQVIAARCGVICSFRDYDYGIDTTLHAVRHVAGRIVEVGVCIDVQLKSTTNATINSDQILYDLEVRTYNHLRSPVVGSPRILVLVVLPEDENLWTDQTEERLLLRSCGYWLSLSGMPATTNLSTIRVAIPRANLFSNPALADLLERAERRNSL